MSGQVFDVEAEYRKILFQLEYASLLKRMDDYLAKIIIEALPE